MSNPENKDAKTNKENSANADSKALDQAQNSNLKNLVVKQGDYQIHVLIEVVSQLASVNDA